MIIHEERPTRLREAERSDYARLVEDFARAARRDGWALGLALLGWLHLGFSLVHQALYRPDASGAAASVALWAAEVVGVVLTMRWACGPGWFRGAPLAGVLVRVWATFLILSFSVATLNSRTGFAVDWFKLAWCSLGSFGFATTAWLLSPWFLVPAFQMYFTGLLMSLWPAHAYLIHGLSWWAALQGIALVLDRRGNRDAAGPDLGDLDR